MAPAVMQALGIAIVAVGLWTIYPPAGIIAAGLGLFAVGFVLDLPPGSHR